MERKIAIHSMIDVITNSSTEIFTTVIKESIDGMYEIIDEILKIADSEKNGKDLFDIQIVYSDPGYVVENYLEYLDNDMGEEDLSKEQKKWLARYRDSSPLFSTEEIDNIISYIEEHDSISVYGGFEGRNNNCLKITAKDDSKSTVDIWNKFFSLFEQEAISNY